MDSAPTELRGMAEERVSPLEPSSFPIAGVSFHSQLALSTGFRRHPPSNGDRHADVAEGRIFRLGPRRVTTLQGRLLHCR